VKASNRAAVGTVALAGVGTMLAGPGLGALVAVVGTILVVVLADREEDRREEETRRAMLRDAAWRDTGRRR